MRYSKNRKLNLGRT